MSVYVCLFESMNVCIDIWMCQTHGGWMTNVCEYASMYVCMCVCVRLWCVHARFCICMYLGYICNHVRQKWLHTKYVVPSKQALQHNRIGSSVMGSAANKAYQQPILNRVRLQKRPDKVWVLLQTSPNISGEQSKGKESLLFFNLRFSLSLQVSLHKRALKKRALFQKRRDNIWIQQYMDPIHRSYPTKLAQNAGGVINVGL